MWPGMRTRLSVLKRWPGRYAGHVQRIARAEGEATLHASTLLHGVSRMAGDGVRYSLILFFHE